MKLPIQFSEKAKQPPNQAAGGYPFTIRAKDLDDNFKAIDFLTESTLFDAFYVKIDRKQSLATIETRYRAGDGVVEFYGPDETVSLEFVNGLLIYASATEITLPICSETSAPPAP